MTERVEKIRQQEIAGEISRLKAALAQAERERDEYVQRYHKAMDEVERLTVFENSGSDVSYDALIATNAKQAVEIGRLRDENETICLGREADRRYRQVGLDNLTRRAKQAEAALARVRAAIDKARRETASDPTNRWCRNATIILDAAWAALEGRG